MVEAERALFEQTRSWSCCPWRKIRENRMPESSVSLNKIGEIVTSGPSPFLIKNNFPTGGRTPPRISNNVRENELEANLDQVSVTQYYCNANNIKGCSCTGAIAISCSGNEQHNCISK